MMPGTLPSAPGAPEKIVQSSKQIKFSWQAPLDSGGSTVQEYEILITRVSDSVTDTKFVINAKEYDFKPDFGLLPGQVYSIKIRATNFYTNYFNYGSQAPWSASSIFYSSDLP
jgi:hypothetical protein